MTEKNRIRGKKSRAAGQRFELKVRADLEKKGWIVDRWSNNVEFEQIEYPVGSNHGTEIGKLIPAKPKFVYNPALKRRIPIGMSSGFPDFIAFKELPIKVYHPEIRKFEVQGIECKSNGKLSKEEKEKCAWYISQHIFSTIYIVKKGEKRGEIIYQEYNK